MSIIASRLEKSASRTRSAVGRVPRPAGVASRRPPRVPATILVTLPTLAALPAPAIIGRVPAHVFVSYASHDVEYVRRLLEHLEQARVPVWADRDIAYGAQWATVISQQIETSAAVIVVMTPEADASTWVAREINFAKRWQKPIFPLLLAGEALRTLAGDGVVDVTDGELPGPDTIDRLRAAVAAAPDPEALLDSPAPRPPASRRLAIGAGLTAVLALAVAAIFLPPLWSKAPATTAPTTGVGFEPSTTPPTSSAPQTATPSRSAPPTASHIGTAPSNVDTAPTTNAAATTPSSSPTPPAKSTLVLLACPTKINHAGTFTGTVSLDHGYPAEQSVELRVDRGGVTMPNSVTVPAGSTQATFSMSATTKAGTNTITATLNGSTVQCHIMVTD